MKYLILFVMLSIGACHCKQKPCAMKNDKLYEVVTTNPSLVGEGAWWDVNTQQFISIDIEGKKLLLSTSDSGTTNAYSLSKRPGTVVPTDKGNFLLALEDSIMLYDVKQQKILRTLATLPLNTSEMRLNDGKCDAKGRLWVGTMDCKDYNKPVASLYKIEKDGKVTEMLKGITISNGIIWSPDNKTMYYIDSPTRTVKAFDFNLEQGTLSNERICIKTPDSTGTPDGCAIDSKGNLWVCIWDGGCVLHYDTKSGKLLKQINLPALNVTSVALGGTTLDTLFVTTASINTPDTVKYPLAGQTFKMKVETPGIASNYFIE